MRKITIIDDNTSFADTLSHELTRRGYSVQSAHTGATGLALVARESPRLVFLDLHLPDMSGFDLLEAVRDNPALADLPVVTTAELMSAFDTWSTDPEIRWRDVEPANDQGRGMFPAATGEEENE